VGKLVVAIAMLLIGWGAARRLSRLVERVTAEPRGPAARRSSLFFMVSRSSSYSPCAR
jgi:hypothetical protein